LIELEYEMRDLRASRNFEDRKETKRRRRRRKIGGEDGRKKELPIAVLYLVNDAVKDDVVHKGARLCLEITLEALKALAGGLQLLLGACPRIGI